MSVEWPLSYANDRKQQELQNNVDFREEAGVRDLEIMQKLRMYLKM